MVHVTVDPSALEQLKREYGLSDFEAKELWSSHYGNLQKIRETLRNGYPSQPQNKPVAQIANQPHNPAPKTKEEEDLDKAIALSLQAGGGDEQVDANLDPELAQAIEMSRKESGLGGATSGAIKPPVVDLTGESDELQATLYASLQSATGRSPIVTNDPNTLARQGDLPVGLKNVGNTCYLNSLIQTYFMIPVLRKAVISYKPVVAVDDTNFNHTFMTELQKLFGALVLSNQRFVDPSPLLKKMVDDQGKPVPIGAQEDVSEFNDIFMTRLTKGLDLVHPPPSAAPAASSNSMDTDTVTHISLSSSVNIDVTALTNARLQRMFVPKALEVVKALEPDGTVIEQSNPIDFGRNFILPVMEETDLFTSLDKFMSDDVQDWETPQGNKVNAKRWKWLRHVPEVIFFHEQRAVWKDDSHIKANHQLKFPEVLHMDRYLLDNEQSVTAIRARNAERLAHLAELNSQIEPYLNCQPGGVKLDTALSGTIKYLEASVARGVHPSHIALMTESVNLLRDLQQQEAVRLNDLMREKSALESEIEASFNELNTEPYSLFAVWVHAGAAVGGHYWSYIREVSSGDWYKMNDTDSSRVELKKVLEDGFGGQGVTSAYFLIYMKQALFDRCKAITDKTEGMPDAIRTALETSNAEFEAKLKEHRANGLEGKIERYTTLYKNKMEQAREYANKFTTEKDMRYQSIIAYLLSVGMEEEAQAMMAQEAWLRTFSSGIGKNQQSPEFEKICQQSIPGTSVIFRAVAINEVDEERKKRTSWDEAHNAFRKVFMFLQHGLALLLRPQEKVESLGYRVEALRHLYVAYVKNQEIVHEIAKRRDLEELLQLAIVVCLQEAIDIAAAHQATTISMLDDVAYVLLRLQNVIPSDIHSRVVESVLISLPERQPLISDDQRFQNILDRLTSPDQPTDIRWMTYNVPGMPTELNEWETLINANRDVYENLKRKFTGFFPGLGLPELRIFQNTASPSATPTVQVSESVLAPEILPFATSPSTLSTASSSVHMNVDTIPLPEQAPVSEAETPSTPNLMDVDPQTGSAASADVQKPFLDQPD